MRRMFLFLASVCFACFARAAEIAIIAHEPGYTTSLATHLQRWLKEQAVPSELATPAEMDAVLKDAKLAFLVGFHAPSAEEFSSIESYRRRGGRLVVFHSGSERLAKLMGVKLLGYAEAKRPGQWSRMDFNADFLEGCPKSIRQSSGVLQRAEPARGGRSRTIAIWCDRSGKPTGDVAWIASPAGYWMTHVLLADGDEDLKSQLLGAFTGSVAPRLWSVDGLRAKMAAESEAAKTFAMRQKRRPGEIHAVWDHAGTGLYPGDWPRTIRFLKSHGVTDLFVNVGGAGFAHYRSGVLPRSKICESEGDQLAKCIAAAKGSGIRVHAWLLCFNATRSSPETLETFRRRGWRLKARDGRLTEYLDPSCAAVRSHILKAVDEIVRNYRPDGIHLDFVRWYEKSEKPSDAADVITKFVAEAKRHVPRPGVFSVAVLGKYPACVASVGQDWEGWTDAGIADYVVPMDYTGDSTKFESFLKQHASRPGSVRKTIIGIGVTANESRLTPVQVINQLRLMRKYGFAGAALFDLDTVLEKKILPYLRLGMW
ncbi:MAG: family 10 glycosylhydrolase [Kiritimatiellae bacterium]|nr:family 10 glycosylhydrolase [Kiritimatiellia bacterium]